MLPDPPTAPRSRPTADIEAPCSPEYHEAVAHRLLTPGGPPPTSQEVAQAQAHATLATSLRLAALDGYALPIGGVG